MPYSLAEHQLRAKFAAAHRRRDRDPEQIAELGLQLRELRLAEHIKREVDKAPPLTSEQRARLAALLSEAA
jgi:hypothetical protein